MAGCSSDVGRVASDVGAVPRNASASSGVSNRKLRVKEAVISVVFFGPLFQTLKCISFDPFCQFDRVKSSAGLGVAGLFRRAEKSGFGRCVGCRGFRSMLTFGKGCQAPHGCCGEA